MSASSPGVSCEAAISAKSGRRRVFSVAAVIV